MKLFSAVVKFNSLKLGKVIGSGCYGTVYQSKANPNRVIKLFSDFDDAYIEFIKFAESHPSLGLPTVYRTFQVRGKRGYNHFGVELEKLSKNRQRAKRIVRPFVDSIPEKLGDGFKRIRNKKEREAFISAYNMLSDCGMFKKFEFDLHPDNLMFRAGIPVITDPVCGHGCP